MKQALENIIMANDRGLFLLDPPTGFGKTTTVVEIIKEFLKGDSKFSNVKKIFFVTNLKTNLPMQKLFEELTEEEKKKCFYAKSITDSVIENLTKVKLDIKEITESKEYKRLLNNVNLYYEIKENNKINDETTQNNINLVYEQIATVAEPEFRKFVKDRYLYNRSNYEKESFIDRNLWFQKLYPICNIEKFDVIFLTTKKFVSMMDTFRRMPFYLYNDEIIENSIFFIDEFDASKQVLLNQIVEDGIKNKIDIVKLFLDIHFALQAINLPKSLTVSSQYHTKKVEEGSWYTTDGLIIYWKNKFKEEVEKYHIDYIIKSKDFKYPKAFLFNDDKYFNIVQDTTKKFIYADINKKENCLSLYGQEYTEEKTQIGDIVRALERNIDGFSKAIFYIANNFEYAQNENKNNSDVKITFEESLYTVLDALNLDDEEKKYLFSKIQESDQSSTNEFVENKMMRSGFNFTEIEDSEYHAVKSVIHNYNFFTTPEDVILRLTNKSLVIGVSATANVKTCIGNYDLNYLANELKDKYISLSPQDNTRIRESFEKMITETIGKYKINCKIVDDIDEFSDRDKCEFFIRELFNDEYQKFILSNIDKYNTYYLLNELKLAFIYKDMKLKGYKSFIGFLNSFPKDDGSFDKNILYNLFDEINKEYCGQDITIEYIKSNDFDFKMNSIKSRLEQGESIFIITTYQTVGSGKNIQYVIPECCKDNVILSQCDSYNMKDFDAIYLLTPTNLIMNLRYDSENKYNDLAIYLFQQEYLYKNKYLSYPQLKINIANGFKKIFFGNSGISYNANGDINNNTVKIIIQAIGRICRCRNKNKNIYIYTDKEIINRINKSSIDKNSYMLNEEFKALLKMQITNGCSNKKLEEYSIQNKNAYSLITKLAYTVRNSYQNVQDWQNLREYVLKNPTADYIEIKYRDLYFNFTDKHTSYSYKQEGYKKNFAISNISFDNNLDMKQVSEQACDLPIVLSVSYVQKLFKEKNYAMKFKKANNIMCPALFKQIYLGALGEVVGKCILEAVLGDKLEELSNISLYEYFDYQIGDVYFDMKHWDTFIKDANEYSRKIARKLDKVGGSVAVVLNLIKRADAQVNISVDERIIQIPYLIDSEDFTINEKDITKILTYI